MLGLEAAVVKVAKRLSERRSRERSTCLAWRVFICVSRQKWGVAWPATGQMTYFGSWMAEISSIPTKTTVCVCVSPATKEQIKFVYFVPKWFRAKILNENWRCRVAKKRPKPVWILNIDHRKGDIYPAVARQRFTFDKHFVPKLCRQKRNCSSEDSWIKGKLRSIEGPLRPRQAGQVP